MSDDSYSCDESEDDDSDGKEEIVERRVSTRQRAKPLRLRLGEAAADDDAEEENRKKAATRRWRQQQKKKRAKKQPKRKENSSGPPKKRRKKKTPPPHTPAPSVFTQVGSTDMLVQLFPNQFSRCRQPYRDRDGNGVSVHLIWPY